MKIIPQTEAQITWKKSDKDLNLSRFVYRFWDFFQDF